MGCCQSLLLRAKRNTSRAATGRTSPRQTSVTIRSNPVGSASQAGFLRQRAKFTLRSKGIRS